MKKITLSLVMVTIAISVLAQPPQAFKYQAVVRDASGEIISNQLVAVRINLLQGSTSGTIVYSETHNPTTNDFGLISLEIGNGTIVSGDFSAINWGADRYFLQVELDDTGGNTYQLIGTSQLLAVPYALYSSSTGDTSKWRQKGDTIFYQTGNVGIGTSNPQGEFHVNNPAEWMGVTFTGSGLNDLNVEYSGYNGTSDTEYIVEVTNSGPNPNIFKWSNDNGSTWTENVPMAISGINVGYGVTIGFNAIIGHTYGDQWLWIVSESFPNGLIVKNGKVGIGTSSPNGVLEINTGEYGTNAEENAGLIIRYKGPEPYERWGFRIGLTGQLHLDTELGGTDITHTTFDRLTRSVGIGTDAPAKTLHIYSSYDQPLLIESSDQYSGIELKDPTTTVTPKLSSDGDHIYFQTDNTTRIKILSNGNVGIGTSSPGAKLDVAGHIWQTGTGNSVFLGEGAGASDDFSNNLNVFVGNEAGTSNTGGHENTAIGASAMSSNTTGYYNTAVGRDAMSSITTGALNTAVGLWAMGSNSTGDYNVSLGVNALYYNQTGSYNTAVGYHAGPNPYIGLNNTGAIGEFARPMADNQIRIGNSSISSIGGYAAWTNLSDKRFKNNVNENVPGLEFIKKLRPITYHLDVNKIDDFLGIPDSLRNDEIMKQAALQKEAIIQTGFFAQEVEEAAQSLGYDFSGVDPPKNEHDFYGLRYAEFVVPLVKAVQEQQEMIQTQQTVIEAQEAFLDQLREENKEMNMRIEKLERR